MCMYKLKADEAEIVRRKAVEEARAKILQVVCVCVCEYVSVCRCVREYVFIYDVCVCVIYNDEAETYVERLWRR
jgi:hypothetical protein